MMRAMFGLRRRPFGLSPVITCLVGVVAAAAVLWPIAASGQTRAVQRASAPPSTGTYPGLSFRLQGCDLPAATTLPISGKFICPDADYSDGNLGKNWSELDLVPHRILITAGNSAPATQTYTFQIAADYSQTNNANVTHLGYDFIENGFEATSSDCQNVQISDPQVVDGTVPANQTVFRRITVTQAQNKTCQLDLYIRLGIGAHLFPGSSLHSELLNDPGTGGIGDTSGIGEKTNSIPTNEVAPQSISKDMSATRDASQTWNVTKSATPSTIDFGDVCSQSFSNTKGVEVKVTWTKLSLTPDGNVHLVTNITASNPSHRTITVSVSDQLYSGTDQTTPVGSPVVIGPVDVPPDTASFALTPASGLEQVVASSATHFNDVATATYTDKDTGIPVPGTATAGADADVGAGTASDSTVDITDSESISGTGLTFAVATPSLGAFTGGYVHDTYTTGPVGWASGTPSQTDTGDVTFSKTIKLDPAQVTSGTLTDTAYLTGSGGFTAQSLPLNVSISSSKTVTLTITKNIPNVLQGSETQSFTFNVYNSSNVNVATKTLSFIAGNTQKSVDVTGLAPDTYTVKETTATGWQPQTDQVVDLTSACSSGATFTNVLDAANAKAVKVTDPTGYEQGWDMTLKGPGLPTAGETVTTNSSGNAIFLADLQEGSYTITEASKTGWTQQPGATGCSFTVSYPADSGKLFTCTITNKSRGHIDVHKTVSGAAPSGTQYFTFTLRQGATPIIGHPGTILETKTANAANSGNISFAYDLVPGTTYQLCEEILAGWQSNLGGVNAFVPEQFLLNGTTLNPAVDNSPVCVNFSLTPAETATTKTFNVDNTPPPGGRALTIGYWKNHGSCSSSSGKNTRGQLDTVLASFPIASGTTHGVFIGELYVDTCAEAVAILDKSTVNTNKKMASDPAYNLAAQLLAYRLNIQAGAGTCANAISAASAAQTLLAKYHFNGTGSYTSGANKMSAADQSLANSLANTLDRYNNDLLC
jgi:hypothetical protein